MGDGGTPQTKKRNVLRAGVVAAATGATFIAMAGTAAAAEGPAIVGPQMLVYNDAGEPVGINEIALNLGGEDGVEIAHCIDPGSALANGDLYVEGTWDETSVGPAIDAVEAILGAGAPANTTPEVLAAADVESIDGGQEDDHMAIFGTRLAIQHFTADFNLGDQVATGEDDLAPATYEGVQAVYEFLVGVGENPPEQPDEPVINFTPNSFTVTPGEPVGPVNVETNLTALTLDVAGPGRLVDGDGIEVTAVTNGDQFFIEPDGSETVNITASGELISSTGRIFHPENAEGQDLIIPLVEEQTVTAEFEFSTTAPSPSPTPTTPAPSPTPTPAPTTPAPQPAPPALADTGANPAPIGIMAAVLLAAGGALALAARRRRSGSTK